MWLTGPAIYACNVKEATKMGDLRTVDREKSCFVQKQLKLIYTSSLVNVELPFSESAFIFFFSFGVNSHLDLNELV